MSTKTNESYIYKEQIKRLVRMLEEKSSATPGLKRMVLDTVGTFNHRFVNYYKRHKYAATLSDSYSSTQAVKSLSESSSITTIFQAINESDQKSARSISSKFSIKSVLLSLAYALYRLAYVTLRFLFRIVKRVRK